jgi:hypothetical protein
MPADLLPVVTTRADYLASPRVMSRTPQAAVIRVHCARMAYRLVVIPAFPRAAGTPWELVNVDPA